MLLKSGNPFFISFVACFASNFSGSNRPAHCLAANQDIWDFLPENSPVGACPPGSDSPQRIFRNGFVSGSETNEFVNPKGSIKQRAREFGREIGPRWVRRRSPQENRKLSARIAADEGLLTRMSLGRERHMFRYVTLAARIEKARLRVEFPSPWIRPGNGPLKLKYKPRNDHVNR